MKPPTPVIGAALESINKKLFFILMSFGVWGMCMSCASVQNKNTAPTVNSPIVNVPISTISNEEFRVGAHTKLFISVYNEPDLTDEVTVLPDGTIDYAFVGKIIVKGSTPKEVENKLTQLLKKDYLLHPQVTVKVREWGMVYVFGKVKNPGILKLKEQETALQAVAAAGGFSEGAQRKVIQVIRTMDKEKKVFTLSLRETENKSLDLAESLYLFPDDTILVE